MESPYLFATNSHTPNTEPDAATPLICYFLILPLEIRNIVYEFFISAAVYHTCPSIYGLSYWQTPSFSYVHKLDLAITSSKVVFRNIRFPSHLFTVNRQVHEELSTLVYGRIHHVKITGDFLLGLAPTQPLFEMLERRPWIRHRTKSVSIDLRLCDIHSECRGVAIDSHVIAVHPILEEKLRMMDLRYFPRWMNGASRSKCYPYLNFWQTVLSLGIRTRNALQIMLPTKRDEEQTLPRLAKLLEGFPCLETVDLETQHHHLLSLFQEPLETAESFLGLSKRGVSINMLLRKWQLKQWANMLKRNGLDESRVWYEDDPDMGLIYGNKIASRMSYGIVKYNLMDCIDRFGGEAGGQS